MELRLRGLGRNEVHRTLKKYAKSSRTVTDVYSEFVSLANQEGVEYAVEVFGVSETVKKLEEIGQICRKNKMDLTDVIELEKQAKKLGDLEKEHGKSFQELYNQYQEVVERLPKEQEERNNLRKDIDELKTKRVQQLRKSEVTGPA